LEQHQQALSVSQHSRHKNLDLTELSYNRHDIEILLDFILTQIKDINVGSLFKNFLFSDFPFLVLMTSSKEILPDHIWEKVFKVVSVAVIEFFVLLSLLNYILNICLLKSSTLNNTLIKSFAVFLFLFLLFLFKSFFFERF
jgi:hypothetical protein